MACLVANSAYMVKASPVADSPTNKSYLERCALLGVHINALNIPQLNAAIAESIEQGQRRIIGCHNLHSIYLYPRDAKMRAFYALADLLHVDGMALVLLARLLGYPLKREHRVTWMDWLDPLMAEAAKHGWRVFYLGSRPGVADRGAEVLRARHPGLQMTTAHGYFDARPGSAENEAVLDLIRSYRPNILMVGMGMPRQEHWILDNSDLVAANVWLSPGACMDYVAGVVPVPPRWMGQVGLEWLFRLASEPRRLWRRYLVEPWFVTALLVRDLLRHLGPTKRRV